MQFKGEFRKMPTSFETEHLVQYELLFFDTISQQFQQFDLNQFIGKDITLKFTGNIYCKSCGSLTKTSYKQGFCYACMLNSPEAAECIIRPELCKAHLGVGKNKEWEINHHNKPHFVYLAAVNVVKVGVTRATQIPTRWIDQGASFAIKLAETPNRYLAGVIEVALKSSFSDKTNWRKMLQNQIDENIDLEEVKWQIEELLPDDLAQYVTDDDKVLEINYPVIKYPSKVQSINLEKTPDVKGKLTGIKGQYLLFNDNSAININKYTGYQVEFSIY